MKVEKILGKKFVRGKPYYKVKWEGMHKDQATWNSPPELIQARDLINKYELKNWKSTLDEKFFNQDLYQSKGFPRRETVPKGKKEKAEKQEKKKNNKKRRGDRRQNSGEIVLSSEQNSESEEDLHSSSEESNSENFPPKTYKLRELNSQEGKKVTNFSQTKNKKEKEREKQRQKKQLNKEDSLENDPDPIFRLGLQFSPEEQEEQEVQKLKKIYHLEKAEDHHTYLFEYFDQKLIKMSTQEAVLAHPKQLVRFLERALEEKKLS